MVATAVKQKLMATLMSWNPAGIESYQSQLLSVVGLMEALDELKLIKLEKMLVMFEEVFECSNGANVKIHF